MLTIDELKYCLKGGWQLTYEYRDGYYNIWATHNDFVLRTKDKKFYSAMIRLTRRIKKWQDQN